MVQRKPIRDNDLTVTFIRTTLLMMNEESRERFIYRLKNEFEPDVQLKLYELAREMIRSWVGRPDLLREDAAIIEDCRKICDVMGWPPVQ